MKNQQYKIVIIEDDRSIRETLVDLLELNNYHVHAAEDGQSGIKTVLDTYPDLVICDINMPLMNGYEVLATLNNRFMGMKVVPPSFLFLSARVQLDDLKNGLKLGADDYVTKPFSNVELLESVKMRIQKRMQLLNSGYKTSVESANISKATPLAGKIEIPYDEGYLYVLLDKVIRCEADRAYCKFHMTDGKKMLVSKPLSDFQDQLEANGFMRTHKSHIVNLTKVEKYLRGKGGQLVLTDRSVVPVAIRKKDEVQSVLRNK